MSDTKSYDELIKLKELLDMGIITEDEFVEKKRLILGLGTPKEKDGSEGDEISSISSELFGCPGCGKRVSVKASTCPGCGYPINKFFEEKRKKELANKAQKKREAENERRRVEKEKYSVKSSYKLCETTISVNINDKICADIGARFLYGREAIHNRIVNLMYEGKHIADMGNDEFTEYMNYLVDIICIPLYNISLTMCEKYLKDIEGYEKDRILDDIQNEYSHESIINALMSAYKGAKNDFLLNSSNAHSKYYDEYYAAGKPVQPIDAIYTNTMLGFVGTSISARLVNGIAGALSENGVKKREKEAADKYSEVIYLEALVCDTKVYSVLDNWVDDYVRAYKEWVTNYLIEKGVLFEAIEYPRDDADFNKYTDIIDNPEITNSDKKREFCKMISVNPGDYFIYVGALGSICFSKDELTNIASFVNFLSLSGDIKEQLIEMRYPVPNVFDDVDKYYDKYLSKGLSNARKYDGITFDSIEEKEKYVVEKEKYGEVLKKIQKMDNWFRKDAFSKQFSKLKKGGVPEVEKWKSSYDEIIAIGEIIQGELKNERVQEYGNLALKMFYAKKTVSRYRLSEVIKKKEQLINEYELADVLQKNELPIILIKGCPNKLLLTTRSFYLISNETDRLIHKFTLDEIERVFYSTKGITKSQYFGLRLTDKEFEVFNSEFPTDDISYLTDFAMALEEVAYTGGAQEERNIQAIVHNTSTDKLSKGYIEKEINKIALFESLLSEYEKSRGGYYVGMFTFEIPYQAGWLRNFIDSQGIGNEYIIWNDNYHIVTDQAFYSSEKYEFSDKQRVNRYVYSDYDEVVATRSYESLFESHKYGFFTIKNSKETLHLLGDESSVCISVLDKVMAATKGKVSSKNTFIHGKEYIYCMECKKFSFVSNPQEMKRCPNCRSKLTKSGMMSYGLQGNIDSKHTVSDTVKEDLEKRLSKFLLLAQDEQKERKKEKNEGATKASNQKTTKNASLSQSNLALIQKGDMKKCPSCNKSISINAKFCNFCGNRMV